MINDLPHKNLNLHKSIWNGLWWQTATYVHLVLNVRGTPVNMKTEGLEHFIESLEPDKTTRQERRVWALFKAAPLTEISGLESECWPCAMGSMGVILRSQGDREEVEKNKRLTIPEYMYVQMCMHSGKCAKLSKFIKSEKIHQQWWQPNLTPSEWSE